MRNDDYLTKYIILLIIYMFSDDCEHILTYIASSMQNEEGDDMIQCLITRLIAGTSIIFPTLYFINSVNNGVYPYEASVNLLGGVIVGATLTCMFLIKKGPS